MGVGLEEAQLVLGYGRHSAKITRKLTDVLFGRTLDMLSTKAAAKASHASLFISLVPIHC